MMRGLHRIRLFLVACFCALLPGLFSACELRPPVKIGFTAEISGKQSELGIGMRNGVEMAVAELNAAGGIKGRQIELIIEDDLGTLAGARDAQNRLINAGAIAVIGHFTSNQTMAGFEVTSSRGVVLLSPTASTSLLSDRKDLFLRTVASTDWMGVGLAEYLRTKRELDRVAIILDEDNDTYSLPMASAFQERFVSLGGGVTGQVQFLTSTSPDFAPLVSELKTGDPQAVLIIASPLDAAVIAQTIALQAWQPALFAASWAQGEGLIQNGGKSVEGMEMIIGFDANDPSDGLNRFKVEYEKRYGRLPMFTAMEGYETMLMLAEALKITGGTGEGLPEALIGLKDFQGLTGPVAMDEYGDAVRPLYIQRVIERQFITIDTISPQE